MLSPTFDRMFRRQLNSEDTFCARDERPCEWNGKLKADRSSHRYSERKLFY